MKKILSIFALAGALLAGVSCNNKEEDNEKVVTYQCSADEAFVNNVASITVTASDAVSSDVNLTLELDKASTLTADNVSYTNPTKLTKGQKTVKIPIAFNAVGLEAGEYTASFSVAADGKVIKSNLAIKAVVDSAPVDLNGDWGITGAPWSWGEVEDTPMRAVDGGWYEATGVALVVGDEFKFRRDKGWDVNFGLPAGATFEEGVEFVVEQNGGNLQAPRSGEFTLSLNPNKGLAKVVCTKPSEEKPDYNGTWSVIGVGNDWDTDIDMQRLEEDGEVAYMVQLNLTEGDQLKFRMNHSWDINFGAPAGEENVDMEPEDNIYVSEKNAVRGGENFVITMTGIYAIVFSPEEGFVGFAATADVPDDGLIKIDGEFSDWDNIPGVSNGAHGMFKFAKDDKYAYFYSFRNTTGRYSEIWGGSGYVYIAFDLDNNGSTGETLWGNGPYEFVGVIYPYAGTAEEPAFNSNPGDACLPSGCTLANTYCQGAVTDEGAIIEFRVPLSDLPALPEAFTVYSWGNKDLSRVEISYPAEAGPKEMVPFDPENFAAIDWSNKEAATWYYFAENYSLPDGFTFILHIYPYALNTAGMRVGNFGNNTESPCNMLRFGQNGDNAELEWMVDHADGRSQKELLAKGFVTEKWQAIVLTADKATGSYKIYRNAELGAEKTFNYNTNMGFGAFEFANSWGASWRSAFNGRMALMSVYNKALTAEEIAQNIFTTPVSDACVGFWPMNDGEGGILAADQSRAIKEQIDLSKAVRNDNDNTTQNHDFDATPYITWTTGNKIEKDEPVEPVLTVSEFIALEDNAEATFSGIVAAVATNGSVITDGQKNIYVFKPTVTPAVGDKVTVKATKTTYYGLIETKQGGELTVESQGNEVPHTELVDITATFDAYPDNAPTTDYVTVKATIAVSGNYVNFTVAGAEARQGSVQGMDLKAYDGKLVVLKGYYIGTSGTGGKYVNIAVTDMTPVATDGNTGEDLDDPIDTNPWE